MTTLTRTERRRAQVPWSRTLRHDGVLYAMALVPIVYLVIFRYVPMIGNVIAFRRFRPGGSILGEEWVGLRYVSMFLSDPTFWHVFANTAILGALTLIVCFPLPIILALMLNEVRKRAFKTIVQSITYLPHFLSVVIVVGIVMQLLSLEGTVNQIITAMGGEKIPFLQKPEWFRTIYVGSEVWQTVGWGTILYLAALTTIDDSLYEAARIDGANRWQTFRDITVPLLRPTFALTTIMCVTGSLLAFEQFYILTKGGPDNSTMTIVQLIYNVAFQGQNSLGIAGALSVIVLLALVVVNVFQMRAFGRSDES